MDKVQPTKQRLMDTDSNFSPEFLTEMFDPQTPTILTTPPKAEFLRKPAQCLTDYSKKSSMSSDHDPANGHNLNGHKLPVSNHLLNRIEDLKMKNTELKKKDMEKELLIANLEAKLAHSMKETLFHKTEKEVLKRQNELIKQEASNLKNEVVQYEIQIKQYHEMKLKSDEDADSISLLKKDLSHEKKLLMKSKNETEYLRSQLGKKNTALKKMMQSKRKIWNLMRQFARKLSDNGDLTELDQNLIFEMIKEDNLADSNIAEEDQNENSEVVQVERTSHVVERSTFEWSNNSQELHSIEQNPSGNEDFPLSQISNTPQNISTIHHHPSPFRSSNLFSEDVMGDSLVSEDCMDVSSSEVNAIQKQLGVGRHSFTPLSPVYSASTIPPSNYSQFAPNQIQSPNVSNNGVVNRRDPLGQHPMQVQNSSHPRLSHQFSEGFDTSEIPPVVANLSNEEHSPDGFPFSDNATNAISTKVNIRHDYDNGCLRVETERLVDNQISVEVNDSRKNIVLRFWKNVPDEDNSTFNAPNSQPLSAFPPMQSVLVPCTTNKELEGTTHPVKKVSLSVEQEPSRSPIHNSKDAKQNGMISHLSVEKSMNVNEFQDEDQFPCNTAAVSEPEKLVSLECSSNKQMFDKNDSDMNCVQMLEKSEIKILNQTGTSSSLFSPPKMTTLKRKNVTNDMIYTSKPNETMKSNISNFEREDSPENVLSENSDSYAIINPVFCNDLYPAASTCNESNLFSESGLKSKLLDKKTNSLCFSNSTLTHKRKLFSMKESSPERKEKASLNKIIFGTEALDKSKSAANSKVQVSKSHCYFGSSNEVKPSEIGENNDFSKLDHNSTPSDSESDPNGKKCDSMSTDSESYPNENKMLDLHSGSLKHSSYSASNGTEISPISNSQTTSASDKNPISSDHNKLEVEFETLAEVDGKKMLLTQSKSVFLDSSTPITSESNKIVGEKSNGFNDKTAKIEPLLHNSGHGSELEEEFSEKSLNVASKKTFVTLTKVLQSKNLLSPTSLSPGPIENEVNGSISASPINAKQLDAPSQSDSNNKKVSPNSNFESASDTDKSVIFSLRNKQEAKIKALSEIVDQKVHQTRSKTVILDKPIEIKTQKGKITPMPSISNKVIIHQTKIHQTRSKTVKQKSSKTKETKKKMTSIAPALNVQYSEKPFNIFTSIETFATPPKVSPTRDLFHSTNISPDNIEKDGSFSGSPSDAEQLKVSSDSASNGAVCFNKLSETKKNTTSIAPVLDNIDKKKNNNLSKEDAKTDAFSDSNGHGRELKGLHSEKQLNSFTSKETFGTPPKVSPTRVLFHSTYISPNNIEKEANKSFNGSPRNAKQVKVSSDSASNGAEVSPNSYSPSASVAGKNSVLSKCKKLEIRLEALSVFDDKKMHQTQLKTVPFDKPSEILKSPTKPTTLNCYVANDSNLISELDSESDSRLIIDLPDSEPHPVDSEDNIGKAGNSFGNSSFRKTKKRKRKSKSTPSKMRNLSINNPTNMLPNLNNIESVFQDMEKIEFNSEHFNIFVHNLVNTLINPDNSPKVQHLIYNVVQHLHLTKRNPLFIYGYEQDTSDMLPMSEKCIVTALFQIEKKGKPQFHGLLESTVVTFYNLVLGKENTFHMFGLASLCRVLTEICKRRNNRDEILKLCGELLKFEHQYAPYLIASAIGVWKEAFQLTENADEEQLFFAAVARGVVNKPQKNLSPNDWKLCKAIFSKLLPVKGIEDKEIPRGYSRIVHAIRCKCIENVYDKDYLLTTPLVVYSRVKGWQWSSTALMETFVVRSLQKFSKELNKIAFEFLLNLYAEISYHFPKEENPSGFLEMYFGMGDKDVDFIPFTAAIVLLKFKMLRQECVAKELSEWMCKWEKNAKVTALRPLFVRCNMRNEEFSIDDIIDVS